MNKTYSTFWGIDISKEWMDISIDHKVSRVKQTKKEINSFIKEHLTTPENSLVVLEHTGGYELLATECLSDAGMTVHVAHPTKVRRFAQAKGCLAKSDKLDAKILEEYGHFINPDSIRPLPTKLEYQLSTLNSRLNQLKECHHQETCRAARAHFEEVKCSHQAILEVLSQQIKKIEQKMLSLIQSDEALKQKYDRIQTMKGVGPTLALTLIADLPELGQANKKEIAALVGIAPITKESGKQRGKAITQNGRQLVRRMLYMGALVAARWDSKMKAFYDRLIAKGKPKKVALVALMRKMLVVLNAMIIKNESYHSHIPHQSVSADK